MQNKDLFAYLTVCLLGIALCPSSVHAQVVAVHPRLTPTEIAEDIDMESDVTFIDYNLNAEQTVVSGVPVTYYTWEAGASAKKHPRQTIFTEQEKDAVCKKIKTLYRKEMNSVLLASDKYSKNELSKGAGLLYQYKYSDKYPVLQVHYAMILEYILHERPYYSGFENIEEYAQPVIYITLMDMSGNIIDEKQYMPSNLSSEDGWNVSGDYAYRDWNTLVYDFTGCKKGDAYVLSVHITDCAIEDYVQEGGGLEYVACEEHHAARAYVSLELTSTQIKITDQDCVNGTTTLKAPDGYQTYEWFNKKGKSIDEGQEITITTPSSSAEYFCRMGVDDDYAETSIEVENECPESSLKQKQDCDNRTVKLTAPAGWDSYKWYSENDPTDILSIENTCVAPLPRDNEMFYCLMNGELEESILVENECPQPATCEVELTTPDLICADATSMSIKMKYLSGDPETYSLIFDSVAHQQGFRDIKDEAVTDPKEIVITLPERLRPETYSAILSIQQSCDSVLSKEFAFHVLYPDSIIKQKWNDVLVVYNSNYNGGYVFSSIAWYEEDIEGNVYAHQGLGANGSYMQVSDSLHWDSKYWAELTRVDDGRMICTCPIIPTPKYWQPHPIGKKVRISAIHSSPSTYLDIQSEVNGQYTLYDITGRILTMGEFGSDTGTSTIVLPATFERGTYIIHFQGVDGTSEVEKIAIH